MGIDLGNLAALRTFRVLRALKTVAIVPGMLRIEVVVDANTVVLDNTCRDRYVCLPHLITYLQQFHFIVAYIALRIIVPFVTRYSYSIRLSDIYCDESDSLYIDLLLFPFFPYFRSSRRSRETNYKLDA